MDGNSYDEELAAVQALDGGFYHTMPRGSSELMSYINRAVSLVGKAFDYPWEVGFDWPLGFRFDGYHQDGFTFTVFFRIDKDCPFMVRFDGVEHYSNKGQGFPLGDQWTADTTIRSWEV